jgi:hypothetical protein
MQKILIASTDPLDYYTEEEMLKKYIDYEKRHDRNPETYEDDLPAELAIHFVETHLKKIQRGRFNTTMDNFIGKVEHNMRFNGDDIFYKAQWYDTANHDLYPIDKQQSITTLLDWYQYFFEAYTHEEELVKAYFEGGKIVIERYSPVRDLLVEVTAYKIYENNKIKPIKIDGQKYI